MDTTQRNDRLVCGLDDSEHAASVLAVATELAQRLGLRLTLVHSADPDLFLVGERRRAAVSRGAAVLDALISADAPQDRVVELGEPATLLRAVLEEGAALAVVGSRGRGPARAAAFGSISNALIGSAPCPVVVVPPLDAGNLVNGPAAVICGVDGTACAGAVLAAADALACRLGSELVVVHVAPDPMVVGPALAAAESNQGSLASMEHAVENLDRDLPVRMRIETGDAVERLSAVAEEQRSAIIVVGRRGLGPLRSALLGSVSSRLAASARVPVVVVPRGSGAVAFPAHHEPVPRNAPGVAA